MTMRLALISDIRANLPALEAVLDDIGARDLLERAREAIVETSPSR
jgi:hypothetical protein